MAINLTTLFTRLGKLALTLNDINTFRGITMDGLVDDINTQYNGSEELIPNLQNALNTDKSSHSGMVSALQTIATDTVVVTVNADNPQPDTGLTTSLEELIKQMNTASASIASNTVSASTSADAGNVGDGAVSVSLYSRDGLPFQMPYAEDVVITCVGDSQTGYTEGYEPFTLAGEYSAGIETGPSWPAGSGASQRINCIDAVSDATNGNFLVDGIFEGWTISNVPDSWELISGTVGTDCAEDTIAPYSGTACTRLENNTILAQTFNDLTGTTKTLDPNTVYSVCFWAKNDSAVSGGTLVVRLYDVTNSDVMQNDNGVDNSTTFNLTSFTTSWAPYKTQFITPKFLPAEYRLEFVGTVLATEALYIDHVSLGEMRQLYTNGPWFAVHSGINNFVTGDEFTTTISNSYSSAWALALEQLFSLNSKGLIIPNSGSETIADTLLE